MVLYKINYKIEKLNKYFADKYKINKVEIIPKKIKTSPLKVSITGNFTFEQVNDILAVMADVMEGNTP